MNPQPMPRNLLILVLIAVVLVVGYAIFMQPDQRTATQKVGDAIHELPNGVGKASSELNSDRNPGQKLGDAVRNAGDKIKENSDPQ